MAIMKTNSVAQAEGILAATCCVRAIGTARKVPRRSRQAIGEVAGLLARGNGQVHDSNAHKCQEHSDNLFSKYVSAAAVEGRDIILVGKILRKGACEVRSKVEGGKGR